MIFYGFKSLQRELKRRKLRYTRPYLTSLEQTGKIQRPENYMRFHDSDFSDRLSSELIRIYSMDEINVICEKVYEISGNHTPRVYKKRKK